MREIKFRGYLKKESKMFPVCDLNFNGVDQWGVGISSCGRLDCGLCEDHYEHADVEVMQYTGLKDKNSVEIYEGDIMKGGILHLTGGVRLSNEDVATTVKYEDGMYKLGGISLRSFNRRAEVIGNIHENPELLGGVRVCR